MLQGPSDTGGFLFDALEAFFCMRGREEWNLTRCPCESAEEKEEEEKKKKKRERRQD
jgi:hypothetical protein